MQTLIHADIFFFITSIAVAVFTVAMIIASIYVIYILKDMKRISTTIQKEADKIADDIDGLRDLAKTEGTRAKSVFSFFLDLFMRRQHAARARRSSKD